MKVLEKLSLAPKRLGDMEGKYFATDLFNEVNAQRDGIITRSAEPTFQPHTADSWVLSGPHFFVANSLNKTARTICTANGHYDAIDLENIAEDYLPRAVYRPGDKDGSLDKFCAAIPEWPKPRKPFQDKNGIWHPGFWPVAEHEIPAYEALLGEPLKLYAAETSMPGAKTARKFGFFNRWASEVGKAISWLLANNIAVNSGGFKRVFGNVQLSQIEPQQHIEQLPIPLTCRYRYINREMAQPANERSLIPTVIPPGATHLYTGFSVSFLDKRVFYSFSACNLSIAMDFFIKLSGRGHCRHDLLQQLPILSGNTVELAINRWLRLTCLTAHYSDLWCEAFSETLAEDRWVISNENLEHWGDCSSEWCRGSAVRRDISRRQALLEIDVLVAIALDLSLDELIQIYTVQFPVMKAYEEADQYDTRGQRLPNTTRKDAGAKELREALKNHDGESPITVSWEIDNGLQAVTKTFYPPFKHVDRIEDYKTAYRVFSERLGLNNNSETKE